MAFLLSGATHAQQIAGCSLLPSDSIWNTRVDALPLDPASATYVATIGADTPMHPDFGSGEWPPGSGAPIGIPFVVVGPGQAPVPVGFLYAEESDPGPYPIPPDAPIEGGPAATGDRHVLVVQSGSCTLFETFYSFPQNGGASAITDKRQSSRFDRLTSRTLVEFSSAASSGSAVFTNRREFWLGFGNRYRS